MLGGGLRESTAYILHGEPGCGKSTLAAQWCSAVGGTYVTTEEAERAVREGLMTRVRRRGSERVRVIAAKTISEGIRRAGDSVMLVLDSISGLGDSHASSLANIRAGVEYSRKLKRPVVMISHVNKAGELAGLRTSEHAVDGVLRLEGSRETKTRRLVPLKLRGQKPRSVGLTLGDDGFTEGYQEILTLDRGAESLIGSVLVPALSGRGVKLVEVCAAASRGRGKLLVEGIALDRAKRLVATLAARWPSIAGGLKRRDVSVSVEETLSDAQADAAIALAILSALTGQPLPPLTVAWGAVPLVGAIRLDDSWDDRADLARRLPREGALVLDPAELRDVAELWGRVSEESPTIPGDPPEPPRADAGG